MANVVELNDLRSLSRYRLTWDSLLADTPDATFLRTYDWLENYWRHFGSGKQLRVLVVRSGGQSVGILPLCVVRRRHRLGWIRVLTYPANDECSFNGPIGPNPTATLLAALRYVASRPRDWDYMDLPWIAHESSDNGRTLRAMRQVGFAPRLEPQGGTSVIDLAAAGNWECYLASLSPKSRHEVHSIQRHLNDRGDVEFVRHRPDPRRTGDGDAAWDLYDQCEQLAHQSRQNTSHHGPTFAHANLMSFYRDTHAAASRLGMVDMAVLRIAGRPVACWYGYHYAGRVLGIRVSCTDDAPIRGAHAAFMSRLIEDSLSRGDQTFDLGPGSESHQSRWLTAVVSRHRVTYTPVVAVRPQLIRASRWLRQQAASTLRLAPAN